MASLPICWSRCRCCCKRSFNVGFPELSFFSLRRPCSLAPNFGSASGSSAASRAFSNSSASSALPDLADFAHNKGDRGACPLAHLLGCGPVERARNAVGLRAVSRAGVRPRELAQLGAEPGSHVWRERLLENELQLSVFGAGLKYACRFDGEFRGSLPASTSSSTASASTARVSAFVPRLDARFLTTRSSLQTFVCGLEANPTMSSAMRSACSGPME